MASSQSVAEGQVPVNCKLCDTDRPIQWKCMDCSILMCGHCKDKVHSQFKNALDHKIISREEIGMHREELDFTNIKCIEHTGQSSCLYCNTCDVLVCPTCVAKVHKKHDLIEISDEYKMKIDNLKKGKSKMQKNNSNIKAKKDELNKLMSAENSKYSKVRQDIVSHEKTVKEQVEKYFKELINKLDHSHTTVLKLVKSDLNAISIFSNQTEDKINQVQDFIGISNATDFFKEVNMMQKCTEIQEPKIKPIYGFSKKFVPGNITQLNIGSLQDDGNLSAETNISLVINNEYQTELGIIALVSPYPDKSIWLSSGTYGTLQKVKPEGTNLKVISKFDINVYGMAVTPSNQLLLSIKGKTRLQQISSTDELTDSQFDIAPYIPYAIHICDNKLIVGAYNEKLNNGSVIILNMTGDKQTVYEHDEHNQPLFNNPRYITTTSNGNIHVLNKISDDWSGKVIILGQGGHTKNEYTDHLTINKHRPFKPVAIVTTPIDNVVVIDLTTKVLHILNDNGHLISFFNTEDIGIKRPYSLSFNTAGQLYIGCTRAVRSQTKEAKLYKINYAGF